MHIECALFQNGERQGWLAVFGEARVEGGSQNVNNGLAVSPTSKPKG